MTNRPTAERRAKMGVALGRNLSWTSASEWVVEPVLVTHASASPEPTRADDNPRTAALAIPEGMLRIHALEPFRHERRDCNRTAS